MSEAAVTVNMRYDEVHKLSSNIGQYIHAKQFQALVAVGDDPGVKQEFEDMR